MPVKTQGPVIIYLYEKETNSLIDEVEAVSTADLSDTSNICPAVIESGTMKLKLKRTARKTAGGGKIIPKPLIIRPVPNEEKPRTSPSSADLSVEEVKEIVASSSTSGSDFSWKKALNVYDEYDTENDSDQTNSKPVRNLRSVPNVENLPKVNSKDGSSDESAFDLQLPDETDDANIKEPVANKLLSSTSEPDLELLSGSSKSVKSAVDQTNSKPVRNLRSVPNVENLPKVNSKDGSSDESVFDLHLPDETDDANIKEPVANKLVSSTSEPDLELPSGSSKSVKSAADQTNSKPVRNLRSVPNVENLPKVNSKDGSSDESVYDLHLPDETDDANIKEPVANKLHSSTSEPDLELPSGNSKSVKSAVEPSTGKTDDANKNIKEAATNKLHSSTSKPDFELPSTNSETVKSAVKQSSSKTDDANIKEPAASKLHPSTSKAYLDLLSESSESFKSADSQSQPDETGDANKNIKEPATSTSKPNLKIPSEICESVLPREDINGLDKMASKRKETADEVQKGDKTDATKQNAQTASSVKISEKVSNEARKKNITAMNYSLSKSSNATYVMRSFKVILKPLSKKTEKKYNIQKQLKDYSTKKTAGCDSSVNQNASTSQCASLFVSDPAEESEFSVLSSTQIKKASLEENDGFKKNVEKWLETIRVDVNDCPEPEIDDVNANKVAEKGNSSERSGARSRKNIFKPQLPLPDQDSDSSIKEQLTLRSRKQVNSQVSNKFKLRSTRATASAEDFSPKGKQRTASSEKSSINCVSEREDSLKMDNVVPASKSKHLQRGKRNTDIQISETGNDHSISKHAASEDDSSIVEQNGRKEKYIPSSAVSENSIPLSPISKSHTKPNERSSFRSNRLQDDNSLPKRVERRGRKKKNRSPSAESKSGSENSVVTSVKNSTAKTKVASGRESKQLQTETVQVSDDHNDLNISENEPKRIERRGRKKKNFHLAADSGISPLSSAKKSDASLKRLQDDHQETGHTNLNISEVEPKHVEKHGRKRKNRSPSADSKTVSENSVVTSVKNSTTKTDMPSKHKSKGMLPGNVQESDNDDLSLSENEPKRVERRGRKKKTLPSSTDTKIASKNSVLLSSVKMSDVSSKQLQDDKNRESNRNNFDISENVTPEDEPKHVERRGRKKKNPPSSADSKSVSENSEVSSVKNSTAKTNTPSRHESKQLQQQNVPALDDHSNLSVSENEPKRVERRGRKKKNLPLSADSKITTPNTDVSSKRLHDDDDQESNHNISKTEPKHVERRGWKKKNRSSSDDSKSVSENSSAISSSVKRSTMRFNVPPRPKSKQVQYSDNDDGIYEEKGPGKKSLERRGKEKRSRSSSSQSNFSSTEYEIPKLGKKRKSTFAEASHPSSSKSGAKSSIPHRSLKDINNTYCSVKLPGGGYTTINVSELFRMYNMCPVVKLKPLISQMF